MKEESTFCEIQRLNKIYLFLIVILLGGLIIPLLFFVPISGILSIPIALFMLLYAVNMFFIYMRTFADKEGIHIEVRHYPFYTERKSYLWEDISSARIAPRRFREDMKRKNLFSYDAMRGIGINFFPVLIPQTTTGTHYSRYNLSAKMELQLIAHNGREILIGTKMAEELLEICRRSEKNS